MNFPKIYFSSHLSIPMHFILGTRIQLVLSRHVLAWPEIIWAFDFQTWTLNALHRNVIITCRATLQLVLQCKRVILGSCFQKTTHKNERNHLLLHNTLRVTFRKENGRKGLHEKSNGAGKLCPTTYLILHITITPKTFGRNQKLLQWKKEDVSEKPSRGKKLFSNYARAFSSPFHPDFYVKYYMLNHL